MKVLFLDIDGVLNNPNTTERCGHFIGVDRKLSEKLLDWLDGKNIDIVLSSTWRLHPEMWDHLHEAGIRWIDVTPQIRSGIRGQEIAHWILNHQRGEPVENYAILDDMPWMLSTQQNHFVRTNEDTGLTDADIDRLEEIFA